MRAAGQKTGALEGGQCFRVEAVVGAGEGTHLQVGAPGDAHATIAEPLGHLSEGDQGPGGHAATDDAQAHQEAVVGGPRTQRAWALVSSVAEKCHGREALRSEALARGRSETWRRSPQGPAGLRTRDHSDRGAFPGITQWLPSLACSDRHPHRCASVPESHRVP